VIVGWGTVAYITILVIFVTALPLIRRRLFEVFKVMHYLFILAGIGLILHVPEGWNYMVLPAVAFSLDLVFRWYRFLKQACSVCLEPQPGGILKITATRGRHTKRPPMASY